MLTKLIIRNFKRFREVEVELGNPVVFIGPNNSGKTTALQALALWELGVKRWHEKHGDSLPAKRPGVTINRLDLFAVPILEAKLLWRDLHLRVADLEKGTTRAKNVRIDVIVEGVRGEEAWVCGFEFDYTNAESLICRPLRLAETSNPGWMPVPEAAVASRIAFLPPMSGLMDREFVKQPGEIDFLIGQGRTAEVLRNLCYQLLQNDREAAWNSVVKRIRKLFGVTLDTPRYIPERSEIAMTYQISPGVHLDLSSSGRGLQQTLLLLAYLAANPGSILLLDEPDAHLEILRQRHTYDMLTEMAQEQASQLIIASHSEVILNQAADRDMVVAFLGRPHRIDDRAPLLLKSLKDIGFDQYYQAAQTGWVLYVEGPTDLKILKALADKLGHPAAVVLERPFVHYVSSNHPQKAREHFYALREAKPELVGLALFDRLPVAKLRGASELVEVAWQKREIENYLCQEEVLLTWARETGQEETGGPLFATQWEATMQETITEMEKALSTLNKNSPWSDDIKASDEFLDPLFESFYRTLNLPNLMRKTDYHTLARFITPAQIDPEVEHVLDQIVEVAKGAKPEQE